MSIFGRGKKPMSDTAKFIMAKGRAVGNIAPPPGAGKHKGRGTKPKSAPMKTMSKGQKTENDLTKGPYKDRRQSSGRVNSGWKVH